VLHAVSAAQAVPTAVQVPAAHCPPVAQATPSAQQGWPRPPQEKQALPRQVLPPVHRLPSQHSWPGSPHFAQVPETQREATHTSLAQQGAPGVPQATHLVPLHTFCPLQVLFAQHTWFSAPQLKLEQYASVPQMIEGPQVPPAPSQQACELPPQQKPRESQVPPLKHPLLPAGPQVGTHTGTPEVPSLRSHTYPARQPAGRPATPGEAHSMRHCFAPPGLTGLVPHWLPGMQSAEVVQVREQLPWGKPLAAVRQAPSKHSLPLPQAWPVVFSRWPASLKPASEGPAAHTPFWQELGR
jgi:hypothetical protein